MSPTSVTESLLLSRNGITFISEAILSKLSVFALVMSIKEMLLSAQLQDKIKTDIIVHLFIINSIAQTLTTDYHIPRHFH